MYLSNTLPLLPRMFWVNINVAATFFNFRDY